MIEVLEKIGPEKFSAIISDAESAMIAAKRQNSYPASAALRDKIIYIFTIAATKRLINNQQFWINIKQLRNLITPVKRAVKDVEFQSALLADVFVELIKLAIAIQEIPTPLNDQFRRDSYFFHPAYRGNILTHSTYKKVVLRKALEIWKQTGESVDNRRTKIKVSHLKSMAQIHSYLTANAQNELNFISYEISQDEFTAAFNQIAIAMEEGIDLFEENDSFLVFDEDDFDNDDNDLQLQDENGLNLKIGEIINLTTEKSGSINNTNDNESRIEHENRDFNIDELLQDD
ncbi:hypothetical protein C1645_831481 [Glomus cerebriforme]|uniref:Uncharacterized protein n=1 Tax=Glomus cerebriforme TaxID=658196 RepID=A0A397SQP5_9GLOM|nr:hypothetical protein C1645_831481 [Glomus cerebriforme]